MNCDYFTQGTCLSCVRIETPYEIQLAQRQQVAETLLSGVPTAADIEWETAAPSSEEGFRSKAKMVVGGTAENPTLGLLNEQWQGIDLSNCPILHPAIRRAMPRLREFIQRHRIEPYQVDTRKGELKYILITADAAANSNPDQVRLLIRFVLRSRNYEALLRSRLAQLREMLPQIDVVTVNLHPQHAALVEGDEEIVLTPVQTMPLTVGDVTLYVGPRSFTQTNTDVAAELYRTVARWACTYPADSLWDLYCGVGGFGLHAVKAGVSHVTGVEISDGAIESATVAAQQLLGSEAAHRTCFIAGDATTWAREQSAVPEVVIVNPPRRGIGIELAQWINESGCQSVVYSSCNPHTLAKDLQQMTNYRVVRGRLFDMFPHTDHAEVAVLCQRMA